MKKGCNCLTCLRDRYWELEKFVLDIANEDPDECKDQDLSEAARELLAKLGVTIGEARR